MNKYTFSINGIQFHRISKALANKLFTKGFPVMFCANNLRPDRFGIVSDMWNADTDFTKVCDQFSFYNCMNAETGKYIAFYVPEKYYFHFTFSDGSNPYIGWFNPENMKAFTKWEKLYKVNLTGTNDFTAYYNLERKDA